MQVGKVEVVGLRGTVSQANPRSARVFPTPLQPCAIRAEAIPHTTLDGSPLACHPLFSRALLATARWEFRRLFPGESGTVPLRLRCVCEPISALLEPQNFTPYVYQHPLSEKIPSSSSSTRRENQHCRHIQRRPAPLQVTPPRSRRP